MPIQQEISRLLQKLLPAKRRAVKRSSASYLQEQGWKLTGSGASARWDGFYRSRFGSYKGRIVPTTPPQFIIYKPPAQLRRHPHWSCFSSRGNDWYGVHFSRVPKDLSSGIMRIERIIHEAFSVPKTA
jgi:hypothetical protein